MPDPITRGVDATISCTNSNGLNPLNVTETFSPVAIDVSATIGFVATGNARTTANAGAGRVVVVAVAGVTLATVVDGAMVVVGGAVVVVGAGTPVIENLNIWLRSGFMPPGR